MYRITSPLLLAVLFLATPVLRATDIIFYGGNILTMEGDSPQYVEALAVKNGKITMAGKLADANKLKTSGTQMYNLNGQTLLPGFVDAHSHFYNAIQLSSQVNCAPPPVGNCKNVDDIKAALSRSVTQGARVPSGQMIIGYGYDDSQMPNGRLLTRDDLDEVSSTQPIIVIHVSLHGAVLNSKALEMFNITANTPTPPGGVIIRKPGTNEPYGLIMETAYLPVYKALPSPAPERMAELIRSAQLLYAQHGITTVQESAAKKDVIRSFHKAASDKQLFLDLVAYPLITDLDSVLAQHPANAFGKYNNRFKLGGVKLLIDGSPQAKTALFTTPYLTGGPSGQKDWKGEPTFPQKTINEMLKRAYDLKLQALVHANGDGAIDMLLAAHQFAAGKELSQDRRTVVVHSQFVRREQLRQYAAYQFIPSFFSLHTYYFSDAHIRNRGAEQTSFISPINSAISMGLRYTNHTDFNVLPLDQMMIIWSAVNRISRSGEVIGPNERISPYQALKGITVNAAYQLGEEESKGSLAPGKLADLVILDKDPLKVDSQAIKDIRVTGTFKEGKQVWKQD